MNTPHIVMIIKRSLAVILVLFLPTYAATAKDSAALDQQLIEATKRGKLVLVRTLLGRGADINVKDKNGLTPLMWAAWEKRPHVVRLLLDKGADVNAQDKDGRTALQRSKMVGNWEMVELLKGGELTPYPRTPEGVAQAFVQAALGNVPITVEEMRLSTDVLRVPYRYFPDDKDWQANRKTRVLSDNAPYGFALNKFNIVTGFEIKEVKKSKRYAEVKVQYKRLGWIWDLPLSIAKCRSLGPTANERKQKETGLLGEAIKIVDNQKDWTWDDKRCRFLRITNDMEEVTYSLAKPGRRWRIYGSYEPYMSVSWAIKVLQWRIKEAPTGVRRQEASDHQKVGIRRDIVILEKHLGN